MCWICVGLDTVTRCADKLFSHTQKDLWGHGNLSFEHEVKCVQQVKFVCMWLLVCLCEGPLLCCLKIEDLTPIGEVLWSPTESVLATIFFVQKKNLLSPNFSFSSRQRCWKIGCHQFYASKTSKKISLFSEFLCKLWVINWEVAWYLPKCCAANAPSAVFFGIQKLLPR